MELIIINKRGEKFIVLFDDDISEFILQYKWYITKRAGNKVYARTNIAGRPVLMHRLIMDIVDLPEKEIDHINGNGIDNRRNNLRICTHGENMFNRSPQKTAASKYLGVCPLIIKKTTPHRIFKYWRAQISTHGKVKHLGVFKTEECAALAYDMAAIKLHGEFARLNFPEI